MQFSSIEIENFRTFYGNQKLECSVDPNKKITIIHASNTSGKTNFIDAFRWAFYDKILGEQPQQILNHLSLAEASINDVISARVVVAFEHEGKQYDVIREQSLKKTGAQSYVPYAHKFEVNITDSDGRFISSSQPSFVIDNILPSGMDEYFFLAGENIAALSADGASEKIKNAIKILMGLEIIERAKKHVYQVRGDIRVSVGGASEDSESKKVFESLRQVELDLEQYRLDQSKINDNITAYEKIKEATDAQLRETKSTREIQLKKDALDKELFDLLEQFKDKQVKLMSFFSNQSFLSFSKEIIGEVKCILEERREKGIIPYPYSFQFISDLLSEGTCICKRPLIIGDGHYEEVQKLMLEETKNEFQIIYNEISQDVSVFERLLVDYPARVNDEWNQYRGLISSIAKKREEIEEIKTIFDNKEYEDAQKLFEKNKNLEFDIKELYKKKGSLMRDIYLSETEHINLENECEKINKENAKQDIRVKKLTICSDVYKFLEELHDSLIQRDRRKLEEKINEIFQSIISGREDAHVELDQNFDFNVIKVMSDGSKSVLPKSGAEAQITSLSFIASVIAIAKENYVSKISTFARGGIYPIILDSPFGTMDHEFRTKVAKKLPEFSEQLIILVAPQQWSSQLESDFSGLIGKRYIFHKMAPKPLDKISQTIQGRQYTLMEYTDGKEKTLIEEIPNEKT